MAKGGVHVVAPKEPDHPPAEPDAFGIAGRAADLAGGFGEFVTAWASRRASAAPGLSAGLASPWASAGREANSNEAANSAARPERGREDMGLGCCSCFAIGSSRYLYNE